ncbi:MAG: hypothetical protein RLP09_09600 [Sandaracinaceae bacterium]
MALGKITAPMAAVQRGMVELYAKCVGAGTSVPTGLEGDAISVSRSGAGIYVLTFPGDGDFDVRDVRASIRQAASSDLVAHFTYDEAARTVTVNVKNATHATPFTDADITSSETLHVVVTLKTSKTYS